MRIVNCHLASLALSGEQIDAVSSDRTMDENRLTTLRKAYDKMSIAFAAREKEAEKIADSLPTIYRIRLADKYIYFPAQGTQTLTLKANAKSFDLLLCPHGVLPARRRSASLFRNPKNTFEQQPRSTVFW